MRSGGAFDISFFPGCAVSGMSLAYVLSVHQDAVVRNNFGPTFIKGGGGRKSNTALKKVRGGGGGMEYLDSPSVLPLFYMAPRYFFLLY